MRTFVVPRPSIQAQEPYITQSLDVRSWAALAACGRLDRCLVGGLIGWLAVWMAGELTYRAAKNKALAWKSCPAVPTMCSTSPKATGISGPTWDRYGTGNARN